MSQRRRRLFSQIKQTFRAIIEKRNNAHAIFANKEKNALYICRVFMCNATTRWKFSNAEVNVVHLIGVKAAALYPSIVSPAIVGVVFISIFHTLREPCEIINFFNATT